MVEDLAELERNDTIVWWLCNMTLKDRKFSDELRPTGVANHKKLRTKCWMW